MSTFAPKLAALLMAVVTFVLAVVVMGVLGGVGPIELAVALVLSVIAFALRVRRAGPVATR